MSISVHMGGALQCVNALARRLPSRRRMERIVQLLAGQSRESATVLRMPTNEERLTLERDLYLRVLQILDAPDPTGYLREVLSAMVSLTEAACGYLEIYQDTTAGQRRWSMSHGCSDAEEQKIRAVTSRGIVAAS